MAEAFSFSAPRFTEEDEVEEVASMSEEERIEVTQDLYGTYTLPTETSDMIAGCMQAMERALERIEPSEKESYLQAKERCPELLETESNPLRFLRSQAYDPEVRLAISLSQEEYREQNQSHSSAYTTLLCTTESS
jgi:hypothetical protein